MDRFAVEERADIFVGGLGTLIRRARGEGNIIQGVTVDVVLLREVERHHCHAVDRLDAVGIRLCLVRGDVIRHDLRRGVGGKFLFHDGDSAARLALGVEITRKALIDLDPRDRDKGEHRHRDTQDQNDLAPEHDSVRKPGDEWRFPVLS